MHFKTFVITIIGVRVSLCISRITHENQRSLARVGFSSLSLPAVLSVALSHIIGAWAASETRDGKI